MNCRIYRPLLMLVALLQVTATMSQPTFHKVWDKRYGGTLDESVSNFQQTPDGGYIICGNSNSGISGDKTQSNWDPSLTASDLWLVKTDSLSNIQWERRFGGFNTELINEVVLTPDGGYLVGGYTYSSTSGNISQPNWDASQQSPDYWIIKVDGNGNKVWDKRFGGTSFDLFASLKVTPSGYIYLCGTSLSGINGDKTTANNGAWDYWVLRLTPTGVKLWDKTFGGADDDFATFCLVDADGGVVVGGYSESNVSGDKSEPPVGTWDYWVVKADSMGNKLWDKTYGGNFHDYLYSMCTIPGGGFLIGGQSYSDAGGDKTEPNHDPSISGSDYWVLRLNAQGQKMWDRVYGGDMVEQLSRVEYISGDNFLVSGESYSSTNGDKTEANLGVEQTWVVKIDAIGSILWDKTIFTNGHDELGTAVQSSPLCFTVVNYTGADTGGYKSQSTWGAGDYWMVKMCEDDPSGLETPGISNNDFVLFPNPAVHSMYLQRKHPVSGDYICSISDISGRIVRTFPLQTYNQSPIPIDLTGINKGYYFFTLQERGGGQMVLPFIKQ